VSRRSSRLNGTLVLPTGGASDVKKRKGKGGERGEKIVITPAIRCHSFYLFATPRHYYHLGRRLERKKKGEKRGLHHDEAATGGHQ